MGIFQKEVSQILRINLAIVIYCIIIILSVMYATQPLQPLLAKEFNVSIIKASQFTAVIMLFLAISPIFYGYILEKVCAKKMLTYSSIILLITNIFLGLSTSYEMFMFFRVCEALVIPAILTALMSILANIDKENIKFNMSIYVASTVFGGLVGRIFSGFIATNFSYQLVFYSLSAALFVSILLIQKLDYEGDTQVVKPKLNDILHILEDKRFLLVYFIMFCMFFVFSGVLNVLPFRVKEISSKSIEGLNYQSCYTFDVFVSGILVGKYVRKSLVKDDKGEVIGAIYSRITVGVANDIKWSGEPVVEVKIRCDNDDRLFPTLCGSYPPNFECPQVFQMLDDNVYSLKSTVNAENNIAVFSTNWKCDGSHNLLLNGELYSAIKFTDKVGTVAK